MNGKVKMMTAETSCLKVLTSVQQMVLDGKRDSERVRAVLQTIKNYGDFQDRLAAAVAFDDAKVREELILWQKFDRKFFPDVNVGNYTNLRIPLSPPAGFTMPIVNARGISENMLVARMRKEFGVWTYQDDLSSVLSDRSPVSSSYVILVRDCIEADEELMNRSAGMIADEAIQTETLQERLRHGFFHWFKTGKYLDVINATLCAGSRYADGGVPYVRWYGAYGELGVGWYDPGSRHDSLRPRAVSA